MVNMPIQAMSSAHQNRLKHRIRRTTSGENPSVPICASITNSQKMPALTCSP